MSADARTINAAPRDRWNRLRRRAPRLLLELIVNFAGPALIYQLAHGRWGDTPALIASSAPPFLWTIAVFLLDGRVDELSILSLAGLALSFLAFFGNGSPRQLELRGKLATLLIGLAFLGSAAVGKPLIYHLARALLRRESKEALAAFDARSHDAVVRKTLTTISLVWGFGLLADFTFAGLLIYSLPIGRYLVVGPILGYGFIGGLTLWTVLYRRKRKR